MYKVKFKTAYLQKEVIDDLAVIGSAPLHVGEAVTLTEAAGGNPAYISAATGGDASAVKSSATHIVAQSDQTLEYGHVPVELRDYKYNDEVKATDTAIKAASGVKKVALFKITDKDDIIVYSV